MHLERAIPILQVRDAAASAPLWGDGSDFAIIRRGGVTLGLDRSGDGPAPVKQWWAAGVYTDDVETPRAEFAPAGMSPTEMHHPTGDRCDAFDAIDPDGHRIAFGQDRGASFGL